MIIDCHGHYTTEPAELGAYRDSQKAELEQRFLVKIRLADWEAYGGNGR